MKTSHHAVWWHRLIVLHKVDTVPKNGRYFLIELSLWEALKEVAAGVFEDTGLNDEHAVYWCFYYFHKSMFKLYIECPQADCFGEREFRGINREFKEMSPQADLCGETAIIHIFYIFSGVQ